jgi:pSer/pThr/pTyr-binding forkhead associated (FHA) protein
MNIILAQPSAPDGRNAQLEFQKPTVTIGRDATECDIAFEKTEFPMVSRKHAELRRKRTMDFGRSRFNLRYVYKWTEDRSGSTDIGR